MLDAQYVCAKKEDTFFSKRKHMSFAYNYLLQVYPPIDTLVKYECDSIVYLLGACIIYLVLGGLIPAGLTLG